MNQPSNTYTATAKCFHWVSAFLVLSLLALGFIATNIHKGPAVHWLFWWHKSLGLLLLIIMIGRIIYRLTHEYPKLLPAPRWQLAAASLTHILLYVLIVSTILIGWGMSGLTGHHTSFFGLFDVSLPLPLNKEVAHIGETLHYYIAWTLVVLITSHILAALYHHYFTLKKDDTLKRMT